MIIYIIFSQFLNSDVAHSALSDMSIIAQEPTPKYNSKIYEKESKSDDFLDDYNTPIFTASFKIDPDLEAMGFETIKPIESRHSNISSMFSAPSPTHNDNNKSAASSSSTSSSRTLKTKGGTTYTPLENDDAQKKFGGAKAISSDQFFANEPSSFERSANLAKFQGSNSISSADYFGDNSGKATNRGSYIIIRFSVFFYLHSTSMIRVWFYFLKIVFLRKWRCVKQTEKINFSKKKTDFRCQTLSCSCGTKMDSIFRYFIDKNSNSTAI